MRIVVFGGAGFVGSAVTRKLVSQTGATVLVVDNLGATSSLASLACVAASPRYAFRQADIRDRDRIGALLQAFAPDVIVHAAADRCGPEQGTDTNFAGTWRLIETVRDYWSALPENRRAAFRVVGVSRADLTDGPATTRAAADEIMLSWHKAYGLPAMVARSAAAFGACQFPDAVVPAAVIGALQGNPTANFGPARDWIYIDDLASALLAILAKGTPGAAYTVTSGSRACGADIDAKVAKLVRRHVGNTCSDLVKLSAQCDITLEALPPLDATRLHLDTGWSATETLDSALAKTVRWYADNAAWWSPLDAARRAGDVYGLLRAG